MLTARVALKRMLTEGEGLSAWMSDTCTYDATNQQNQQVLPTLIILTIMKDHISILTNVLTIACERPNSEVGRLIKAIVGYAANGIRPSLDDVRLETYFELIAQDLDAQNMAARIKSKKCSDSAKCRSAKGSTNAAHPRKDANATNVKNATDSTNVADATDVANAANADNVADADVPEILSDDKPPEASSSSESDAVSNAFVRLREVYGKTGDNEAQALGVWQTLSESERIAALDYAEQLQGTNTFRPYLYVYLRDRKWKLAPPVTAD